MSDAPLRIDHVGLTCADIDRSLTFYRDLLGLEVRDRGRSQSLVSGTPGTGFDWADLVVADGRVVELVAPLGEQREPLETDTMRPGGSHVSFAVPDLEALLSRLADAGVAPRNPPVRIEEPGAWHGAWIVYVHDPDDHAVELIQYPDPTQT